MKLNDMFPSNYLKKEDVPTPTRATIASVSQEEISGDNGKEFKPVLHFVGELKSIILNKGNALSIAEVYGDDTEAWHGKVIEVYSDPSVMFAGKRVGGIRVRVPAPNTQQQQPRPAQQQGHPLLAAYQSCQSMEEWLGLEKKRAGVWSSLDRNTQDKLKKASDSTKAAMELEPTPNRGDSWESPAPEDDDPIPF